MYVMYERKNENIKIWSKYDESFEMSALENKDNNR